MMTREPFRLGEWRVEPELNRISAGGEKRDLDPRIMDVLAFLASREGDVISRDELVAAVWGESYSVTENTVAQALSRLRKALGDDWRQPRYIETISKSGYRLVAQFDFLFNQSFQIFAPEVPLEGP